MMTTDCFLHWLTQVLSWHWETKTFASHVALGDSYKDFNKLIDRYIEIFQGKHGTVTLDGFRSCPEYLLFADRVKVFQWFKSYLLIELTQDLDKVRDADLLNIRDEILGELNHLNYLLTLE